MIRLTSRMILAESTSAPPRLCASIPMKVGSTAAGRLAAAGGAAGPNKEAGSSSTGTTATQAPMVRSRIE